MKKIILTCVGFFVALCVFVGFRFENNAPASLGSVMDGQAYTSTTTADWGNAGTFDKYLKAVPGSNVSGTFGSVIITVTAATKLRILDANGLATTTLATFVASPTVGTYTFDTVFTRGLYAVVDGGGSSLASTTITWR